MHSLSPALQTIAASIKLVVFDVDGVLTDGTLTYSAAGEEVKHFNVKDGVGIKLLQAYGIHTAIISAKDSLPLQRRAADLGIHHFFPGSKDKWPVLNSCLSQLNIKPAEVCYVGGDVIDLKVIKSIGLGLAPKDALWRVKNESQLVTQASGGKGVAREVADIILGSRMKLEDAYIKAMLPEFEK